MNYIFILFTSLVFAFSGAPSVPHAELEKAFSANDATAVVAMSRDKVLMTVIGSDGAYSKAQAKLILRDFFTKHPKGSFSFIFKGKESEGGSFSIGNYVSKGETFRVTFHFKQEGSASKIERLIIER